MNASDEALLKATKTILGDISAGFLDKKAAEAVANVPVVPGEGEGIAYLAMEFADGEIKSSVVVGEELSPEALEGPEEMAELILVAGKIAAAQRHEKAFPLNSYYYPWITDALRASIAMRLYAAVAVRELWEAAPGNFFRLEDLLGAADGSHQFIKLLRATVLWDNPAAEHIEDWANREFGEEFFFAARAKTFGFLGGGRDRFEQIVSSIAEAANNESE